MTIRAELADGRVLEFPDGTDPSVIQTTVKRMIAAQPGAAQSSGPAGFSLSDLAASFAQGAYGSTQALTDVFGAGNVASQKLEDLARSSQAGMSSARQAELQRQQERLRQAEATGSTWEEIKAAAKNIAEAPLQSAAQAVGSFAPYLPTMLFGPAAAAALGLGARSVQAANAVAKASPTVIGTAQGAGAVKGAIYDAVYRAEIEDGRSEEEARVKAAAAQEYTGQNIDQILTGAGVGLVAGRYGAERLLTPGAAARASQSMLGRIGTAAAVDVPTEAIQGGQERLAANLALQREGRDVPLFEGVAGQATQEGLLGLLGSAPIAAIRGPDREAIRREEEARVAVTEEELAQRFPDVLPGGFKINREETGRETVPQGFSIMAQGRDEPLSVVDTQEEATAKLESLTKIRAEERNKLLQDEAKINADVQKARDKLERLEATEQTNTEEYQSLKTQMPTMMDESAQKIKDLYDRSESLAKPLTVMPFGQIERVNEQFNVLGPDNKPVGTFKTLGEAEAVVQQTVGEDVFKQTQQRRETAKELYKTFVPQMRKFGLGDVGLNIVDRIENGAGGAYLDKLIRVSLEDATPVQTMRHESLHAMKDLGFFTPQQWKALEERANKQWIKELKETKYDDKQSRYDAYVDLFTKEGEQKGFTGKELDQYVSDAVVEESIADAFGAYDKGAKPPPGMIAALYRKIKNFFASLGQALRGAGFQSADDIFQSIERGRLKPAAEATPAVQEKLSLKTIDDVINDGVDRLVKSARTNRLRRDEDRWLPGNGRADTNLTKVQDGIEKRLKELGVSTERVNGEKQLDKIIYDKVLPAYRAKLKEFENVPYGQEKFSLARERIPLSTRSVIEDEDNAAREALGLNTEAKRGRFNNVRDIARALNNDTLKKHGAMDRKNLTDDDVVKIADAIADEVSYQLGTTAKTGTGLGWYSNNYPNAVKRLQARFPELADNQHARSVFSAIVAVTSNGEKVTKNISNAVELYSKLRDGKPMVAMGNRRATALENNLRSIERLLEDHGTDFEKHLLEEITVKDMNARLREMGEKSDGSYLADTVVPRAAIYFGPKLGAFYANLSGSEGYLTMDLWWTRSINRMRGLLIPKATTASINKFRDMMDQPSASRDEVVAASIPLRNKYKDFGFTTELEYLAGGKEPSTKAAKPEWFKQAETAAGDAYEQLLFDHNLEKMANTIYKNEYEMLEEAPFTASDRAFMYKAARNAQAKLRKSGVDLTLADIQAALWYYEKRLYAKLSGVKADDIGYEEAIIAQASEGDGRAGPSVVFGRKSDAGAVAGREVQRAEKARPEPAVEEKPSGKAAKLSLKTPTSPEFKRWFGESKIVKKDGTPMVMYHGLAKDTTDFTRKTERGAPIFLTDDPEFATRFAADSYESVARNPEKYLSKEQIDGGVKRAIAAIKKDYGKDSLGKEMIESLKTGNLKDATPEAREYIQKEFINLLPTGPHIMPMYVRAERPFDYENPGHIRKVLAELTEDAYDPSDIRSGSWESIENADFQDAIQNSGFDSFYVKEQGKKNLAVYSPTQIKSATGNIGTYEPTSPDIRKSLRSTLPPSFVKSMDKIAPPRYEPSYAERITSAVSGDTYTRIRQKVVNRYERLAEYDRRVAEQIKQMGGIEQLADSKAESAALFSDLSAGILESVMGVHDRVGGAPIFKNGVTSVSNYGGAVKGLIEIFRPIAELKSKEAFNSYQTWAAVKRGVRLNAEGREDLIDAADVQAVKDLNKSNPDLVKLFESVQKDWLAYNNALVKYMKDTGVISPEMAKKYTEHGDYFPFYRLINEEDVAGPKAFSSIGNVKPPRKLKGGENPLGDFFENIVRNSQAAIQAGMKNTAAQRATEQAMRLGEVTRLAKKEAGVNVYRVFENGKEVYYRSHDPLFIEAIKSLNMAELPFIGLLAKPAAILRNLVTKDPAFMLANMMRDSLSAWATTGVKMTPIFSTFKNFGSALAGQSPEMSELYAHGILGGYDYSTGSKDAAREFEAGLRKRAGNRTAFEIGVSPATSLWGALEKGTQASDAATRIEVYKKVLAETGNEAEALWRALEVMNFNRRGNAPIVRIMTAAIPFLNARMQGLDVLWRSAVYPAFGTDTDQAKQRMKTFWVRGMTLLALSSMYWLMTHDDEEYKKQEQEVRDNNWLIPSLGIKIPIPFEVGVLFKVVPERIMNLWFGTDTSKDFTDSMKRQFVSTFGFNPIPQLVLPAYEAKTNYSFFTDRPIIGKGLENVQDKYQIGPSTSRVAQMIGSSVGYSPMKLDHLIKGYTGTIGTYFTDLVDVMYDMNSSSPKPSKRFEQMPVIKRFALDPDARGTVTQYYKLKDDVDSAVRTANMLDRANNFSEYTKYSIENRKLLASKEYINSIENDMKDYRDMKLQIQSAPFSAETKKNLLLAISRMESQTSRNIQTIKKFSQP